MDIEASKKARTFFLLILVGLVISIFVEILWLGAYKASGQEILPSTGPRLFKARPFITIALYFFNVFFGTRLLRVAKESKALYWGLILVGSVGSVVSANPALAQTVFLTDPGYSVLIGITTSPFALSLNMSSIVVAIGLTGIVQNRIES